MDLEEDLIGLRTETLRNGEKNLKVGKVKTSPIAVKAIEIEQVMARVAVVVSVARAG